VTPELVEDLQQFQADYRNQLTGAQPRQLSVLDMLRKRMATSMQDEDANRMADFARGLGASRSPNFFTALNEGFAAQEAGATSRMDRLRQLADTERQAAEQRSQEDYRRQQIEVERERRDIERRRVEAEIANQGAVAGVQMIDDNGRVVLVNPRTGATIRQTGYRSPQELRSARPLTDAARAQIWSRVGREADTLAGIVENVTPTQAQITNRDSIRRDLFRQALEVAAQSGGTPESSSGGTGTPNQQRPSQTLQYPRPQQ
jgi:FtsZ-interacting cell division protein YlmF